MAAGQRAGGTFPTEEAAKAWGVSTAAKLKKKAILRDAKTADALLARMPKKLMQAINNAPYDLDEILEAASPAHSMVGIYFLIQDNEVVYVGQSVDVLGRISRHKRDGKEFDSFTYILCPTKDLCTLETTYIASLMPWMNSAMGRLPKALPVFN